MLFVVRDPGRLAPGRRQPPYGALDQVVVDLGVGELERALRSGVRRKVPIEVRIARGRYGYSETCCFHAAAWTSDEPSTCQVGMS